MPQISKETNSRKSSKSQKSNGNSISGSTPPTNAEQTKDPEVAVKKSEIATRGSFGCEGKSGEGKSGNSDSQANTNSDVRLPPSSSSLPLFEFEDSMPFFEFKNARLAATISSPTL
jgi:hypothetical protein